MSRMIAAPHDIALMKVVKAHNVSSYLSANWEGAGAEGSVELFLATYSADQVQR